MARSAASIQAELDAVNATILAIVQGRQSEFQHEGGDGAKFLSLSQLRALRSELSRELARVNRGTRSRFAKGRPI